MKDKIILDIGRIFDEIMEASKDFHDAFKGNFKDGFPFGTDEKKKHHHWDEKVDYYPAYSFPPANIYIDEPQNLVFEFALAGFDETGVDLQFKGDYLVLNAEMPDSLKNDTDVKYLKRRLKLRSIKGQKYYAPVERFDRENVHAVFKNGILRVVIPGKGAPEDAEGTKINIEKEE